MNSTSNELIAIIDDTRAKGLDIKAVRKQKFDLCNFYMTRTDGRQVGPVKCAGTDEQLNRKYDEAVAYLNAAKNAPKRAA